MPLCGLGAPETERVGATRSHDVEVGHTKTEDSGRAAIAALDGQDHMGRNLKVNEAKPRENRGGGGGGRY